ncbi:Glycosyltransferase involved in cell wall biogenesis [Wenxinia marina DSM 24838]|uniref:Glycosyltransferase involved in cell wall biogenesis n=2 Tax=Wenxinia TaxID=653686 RepID=A0A0D0NLY2_9RHOB|nr:Glycosyltransferase involved in cell wall biogenesis [Wenxinia marina DSM 24838]
MPNYRGAPFLQAAIRSVLAQTYRQIELIVVDDNSQDGSAEILRHEAALDARLKPITLGKNLGPAAARNVALDASSGTWIAVVDSDDLVHPSRIERLLAAADAMNADMIADDLVPFGTPTAAGRTVLGSRADSLPQITAVDLLLSDMGFSGTTSLGYLKPLIRRDCLANLRYDEVLTIGEDFDLCLRLLLGGAVYRLIPDPSYLYRRHSESISHRLSVDALDRRMSAMDRIGKDRVIDRETRHALDRRLRLLGQACRYERLVGQIKGRRAFAALAALVKSPRLALHLLDSLMDRRRRAAHLARSVPENGNTADPSRGGGHAGSAGPAGDDAETRCPPAARARRWRDRSVSCLQSGDRTFEGGPRAARGRSGGRTRLGLPAGSRDFAYSALRRHRAPDA